MTKKKIRQLHTIVTVQIRAAFFFAFPAAWATGFSGVKYLFTQISTGKPLEMTAFLAAFCGFAAFTIVFGRFFCGKACAFGTYGDVLYTIGAWAAKRMKKKPLHIPEKVCAWLRYVKYIVLIAVAALCVAGLSSQLAAGSPWTAFSQIISAVIPGSKGGAGGLSFKAGLSVLSLILFIACSIGMFLEKRFFCRFLCPFGAVFSILPILPISTVSRTKETCIPRCRACRNACPAALELPYQGLQETDMTGQNSPEHLYGARMGECFMCGKCTHICPKSNAGSLTMPGGVAGIILDILKAVVLAAVCIYLI